MMVSEVGEVCSVESLCASVPTERTDKYRELSGLCRDKGCTGLVTFVVPPQLHRNLRCLLHVRAYPPALHLRTLLKGS